MSVEPQLIEVWACPETVEAFHRGIECECVWLVERDDGTFSFRLRTTHAQAAAVNTVCEDGNDEFIRQFRKRAA